MNAEVIEQAFQAGIRWALHHHAEDYDIRLIQSLLARANGNVTKALSFMPGQDLGNGGCCGPASEYGPAYRVECYGTATSHPVKVWIGDEKWDREPDLILTWRQIFEYVAQMDAPRLPGF